MTKSIDDLIAKSISKKNSTSVNQIRETQADILIKNADRALGLDKEVELKSNDLTVKSLKQVRKITVTPQTFSITDFDVEILEDIRNKFLKLGEVISKSETVRMGLQLINSLPDKELKSLLSLIIRKSKNGW